MDSPILPDGDDLELKLLSFTRRARQSHLSQQSHPAASNGVVREQLQKQFMEKEDEID